MQEQFLEIQQTRRYYQNSLVSKPKILLALHGYGQLAGFFYQKFSFLEERFGLIIPEGPHRFYLNGSSGRVGASWMTKEWRLQDIEENTNYLLQLVEEIQKKHTESTIHLLGFSQGGATAARLYQRNPKLFSQLILWASVFPSDIEKSTFANAAQLNFVLGENDVYFSQDKQIEIKNEYKVLGFNVHSFDGGHDIDQCVLTDILGKI